MAQILNSDNFTKEIEKNEVTVVDFFATWCGPCKMLAPVFEELGNEMKEKANFFKVNIDKSLEIAQQYGINTVPTMLVFKNGKVVDKLVGFVPKENIRSKVENQI
ncbi:thioredoxin [Romboutsia sedimentorum]|uniref:Thioredoxin n=1 Tax=Romboutsia sedimentorum TaxID=1368474 RepID=A0ABT7E9K4_9FIRM|nr:thioredoxin [Romboutsia sedimentorum]MDK2563609.1 thioredoxin [Romboutsia sedimentorum]MDK2585969.1 thioredoxin [Romboutsia sedimentorum]